MAGPRDKSGEKSMGPATPPVSTPRRVLTPLEAQMRECFGRAAYSHKTHEKCADLLITKLSRVKTVQILLSALTTGGLITALLGDAQTSRVAAIVAAILSTALLALNTYTKES